MTRLRAADVVLVRGQGWLSSAIRTLSRSPGERPTWVSHCGIMVSETLIVEALSRGVVMRQLNYPASRMRIFRPTNIDERTRRRIALAAELYVGRQYGWTKLVAHAVDGLLGGVRLARRLVFVDRWPICSYVVAAAFESEGYTFGVPRDAATPDDIHDYCQRSEHYRRIA